MTVAMGLADYEFLDDLVFPEMLFSRLVTSQRASGGVVSLSDTDCRGRDGYVGVVTAEDVASSALLGSIVYDRPILAGRDLRYVGEPIAVVVARTALGADLAAGRLTVTYGEPTQPSVTVHAADAPYVVAEDWSRLDPSWAEDICHRTRLRRADTASAFARAHLVLEGTYDSDPLAQLSVEPHGAIAQWRGGELRIWSTCQHPFAVRQELSRVFRLPLSKVRISVPRIGGGFGGKSWTRAEPYAVAAAMKFGQTVKLMLRSGDSALITRRHPGSVFLRTGFAENGEIIAREARIELDTGAYADSGPRVLEVATAAAVVPYRVPAYDVEGILRFSRSVPSGAMRAIGSPQVQWAVEMQMNEAASRLGVDPWQLRRTNLAGPGEVMVDGRRTADPVTPEIIAAIDEVWRQTSDRPTGATTDNVGVGIGLAMTAGGASPASTAVLKLAGDESVAVLAGSSDMGQGSHRTIAQIVAGELAVDLEGVVVRPADTAYTPFDYSTGASRSTMFMGAAVREACHDLIEQARTLCARMVGVAREDVEWQNGLLRVAGQSFGLGQVVIAAFGPGGELIGRGWSSRFGTNREAGVPTSPVFWELSAAVAVVETTDLVGEPRLVRLSVVGAPGRVINRLDGVGGQEEGGAIMGLGAALFESMRDPWEGPPGSYSIRPLRVPLMRDVPPLATHTVEDGSGPGQAGERGIGECSVVASMAAVLGACADAFGAPITRAPVGFFRDQPIGDEESK